LPCFNHTWSLWSLRFVRFSNSRNKPIKHSYFIERGLASIVAGNSHKRLEVGLIGPEGMTGLPIVLGNDRSHMRTFIRRERARASCRQIAGLRQSRSLKGVSQVCPFFHEPDCKYRLLNGTATLEERLARWLLMANDRLDGDEIPLTHEFLSLMLGVRRAGVTVALNYLEHRGVIRLSRQIIITDRKAQASANGTYHVPEAAG
jgi:CRP-like cAMP-binding protein